MIKYIININNYWRIVLYVNVDYKRYDIIESDLTDILAPISVIEDIYNKIAYEYNSGVTFSNPNYRTSIVCINKTTSKEELVNTIVHESNHVQEAICKYYNVPLDSENAAYLIGYIVQRIYKCCSKLLCSC